MAYTPIEIPEPDYTQPPPETVLGFPKDVHSFIHTDGLTYFLGRGKKKSPAIMFVASCPLEEELDGAFSPPMLLKGSPGALLTRTALRAGIEMSDNYFTTLCKYALPRKKRLKPSPADIERNRLLFERELKQRRPKVVVCLGKAVFDYFMDIKLKENEILGGWFTPPARTIKQEERTCVGYDDEGEPEYEATSTSEFECYRDFSLFVSRPAHLLVSKPEYLEGVTYDMLDVAGHVRCLTGDAPPKIECVFTHLDTLDKVRTWANQMLAENIDLFSVDAEWRGDGFLNNELRSIQACWSDSHAVFLQFIDEYAVRTFTPEEEQQVKLLFQMVMNRPQVRFIGHNFSADYLELKHTLGVDPYKRCAFDTMYAMHTVDEQYDLKLERLSMRFTDIGRYDMDLLIWKKQNAKLMTDGGYGAIPTKILFPYSCYDVVVPFRSMPKLLKLLAFDGTLDYYFKIKLPYVTDGYALMTEAGLPLDAGDARRVRESFTMVGGMMLALFQDRVRQSADTWLLSVLTEVAPDQAQQLLKDLQEGVKTVDDLKPLLGAKGWAAHALKLRHWVDARKFNPGSADHKKRWLYDYKEFTPVKSTATDEGPSVDWDKVLALPPAQQRNYTPSTDKDSLQIFAQTDDDCQLLVEYGAISQVTKNFLKGEDAGLEALIRSDGCVHTSFLSTDTNRPRSIRPNILNIPAYLNKRASRGFKRAKAFLCNKYGTDDIDQAYALFYADLDEEERADMPLSFMEPVPLRWCFKAPEGKCFVDADYATAEVFALAYLGNDRGLIERLTMPDPQFVMVKRPEDKGPTPVRIAYIPGITQFSEDKWNPNFLHTLEELGEYVIRDEQGQPVHPLRDVHWEMAEHVMFLNTPREQLLKDIHRAAGKVGNFQCPYQASPNLLTRLIEIATETETASDTGEKVIDTYKTLNPEAWAFLEKVMEEVITKGFYQSPTGAKRHFHIHRGEEVSKWKKSSIASKTQRKASNYPMQSLVGDTLARAVVGLIEAFRTEGLTAQVVVPLYDALYCICDYKDVPRVKELMQYHMSDNNYWDLPGGRLKFNLEFDVTKRWSTKATPEEMAEIEAGIAA